MSKEKALKALAVARNHLDRVQTAAWDPTEPEVAVLFAFYAYEAAVTALSEAKGLRRAESHEQKASRAKDFAKSSELRIDAERRMTELDELRKFVSYGEPYGDLARLDLEDLASELESYIDEVENAVNAQLARPSSRPKRG